MTETDYTRGENFYWWGQGLERVSQKRKQRHPKPRIGELSFTHCNPYTTWSRREGETDGREYVFTDETHVQQLESAGKVIELRAYHTGLWDLEIFYGR